VRVGRFAETDREGEIEGLGFDRFAFRVRAGRLKGENGEG
ncbi:hypothetical protein A2U01_0116161, partial [Trifolium medium]|nr:hypothetical protein [Trifolium medium]